MNNHLKACWLACLTFAWVTSRADIIAQWNFNSVPADNSTSTGTNTPSIGSGTASIIGGISATWASGGGNDPASSADDSAWQTKDYPAQGTGNKTAGVQFNVSTVGYSNVVVRWDQRATKTASKYYRLQFSANGSGFVDCANPIVVMVDSVFEAQTNSLVAATGVNNNPNFSFRIVSEFEDSATGTGLNGYATPYGTNSYDPSSGTVRYEYVNVYGVAISDGNTPPFISAISNQTIRVTQATGPLAFTVLDAEDPATNLTVNAVSSNPAVVPVGNVALSGSGASRTANVIGGAQAGTSAITLWVTDTGGKSNSTTFSVTVLPANIAPVISTVSATNTLMNVGTLPIAFTVGDAETSAGALTVSEVSANPTLLPNANIVFGGSGSNRTVALTPASGQVGVAPITITVSDGTNTANSRFALMVTPSPDLVFLDSFSYANGSLLTNSGFLWANRTGTLGECQVTNGQLQITADQTEDVVGSLIGAPYTPGYGTELYCSFKARFLTLPNSNPDYFAHFGSGTSLRGRIYPFIPVGAEFGTFHLAVGNATNSAELPVDLTTNVTYTLVTRYNIDTATAMLWLNPTDESDPGVTATDSQTPVSISAYGFRQASGFDSTILIDDLKVGLSFAAITNTVPGSANPIPLNIGRQGSKLVLTWADVSFALQSSPSLMGAFTNVPGATSPYTNSLTGAPKFFRLRGN